MAEGRGCGMEANRLREGKGEVQGLTVIWAVKGVGYGGRGLQACSSASLG